jgi:chromosome segregation ATPase
MSEKIDQFCEGLRNQLTKVETSLNKVGESIKAAPQQASDAVKSSLAAAKAKHEANMQSLHEAKAKMEERLHEKKEEVDSQIAEWKTNREIHKLEKRADNAEDYAMATIDFAGAAVVEADLATLEAIEARMDAEDVHASA